MRVAREGQTLKLLRQQLAIKQREVADWADSEKQEAMEQYRYDYAYVNRPCVVQGWKNIDEMIVDVRACMGQLKDTEKLLTSYKNDPDSIPSGAWNNYGRG